MLIRIRRKENGRTPVEIAWERHVSKDLEREMRERIKKEPASVSKNQVLDKTKGALVI